MSATIENRRSIFLKPEQKDELTSTIEATQKQIQQLEQQIALARKEEDITRSNIGSIQTTLDQCTQSHRALADKTLDLVLAGKKKEALDTASQAQSEEALAKVLNAAVTKLRSDMEELDHQIERQTTDVVVMTRRMRSWQDKLQSDQSNLLMQQKLKNASQDELSTYARLAGMTVDQLTTRYEV